MGSRTKFGMTTAYEKNGITGITDQFIIDKWCYIGTIKTDKEDAINEKIEAEYNFDLDMYKILLRYFQNPDNQKMIIPINYPIIK